MTTVAVPEYTEWRRILREQGRSLAWLADRTGVARPTVYAYSRGVRRPTKAWLERTAVALGVPLEELTGEKAA